MKTFLPAVRHRWIVRFRSCDRLWAARHEHVTDYTVLWDLVPWNEELTEAEHSNELTARAQYDRLAAWCEGREQPVKDVFLSKATITERVLAPARVADTWGVVE